MTRLNETFTTDDLPEDTGGNFDPIPKGDYVCEIQGADIKETKKKDGEYINLKLKVQSPTHMGRILFAMLNIKNASAQAEQIGRGQLGSILRALGIATLEDTDQLIGGVISARVDIDPAQNGYEAKNVIKGYKAADGGSAAPAPSKPAQSAPKPASTAPKQPPWSKK